MILLGISDLNFTLDNYALSPENRGMKNARTTSTIFPDARLVVRSKSLTEVSSGLVEVKLWGVAENSGDLIVYLSIDEAEHMKLGEEYRVSLVLVKD